MSEMAEELERIRLQREFGKRLQRIAEDAAYVATELNPHAVAKVTITLGEYTVTAEMNRW